jgi:O-antigen/teichoic acid export membrane protein
MTDADEIEISTLTDTPPVLTADLVPTLEYEPGTKPRSLIRNLVWTALTSFGVMGINFVTGVLVCRLLAAEGRGQIAAIGAWCQIFGWGAGMGFYEAITYMRAKNSHDPKRILGSAVVVTVVFGTVAMILAELLVSRGFREQSPEVIRLARFWMFTIYLAVGGSMCNAMITGNHEFSLLNTLRVIQPLAYLIGLLLLWIFGGMGVLGVMSVASGCELAVTGYLFVRLLNTIGIGLPTKAILREGLAYGIRVQGALFAALANARLDIMLMPGLLFAADIGLYSVSTNLSGIIVALLGSFGVVVFPTAARAGAADGLAIVTRSLRFVFWAGLIGSGIFFILCPWMLHWVYGPKFDGAVPSLRWLLPGVVAVAATKIVDSGLQSVNKPQRASYAQIVGLVVTLTGLYLTLKKWGINGAALTSTLSYTSSFAVALYYLSREKEFSAVAAFSPRLFARDMQTAAARLGILPPPRVGTIDPAPAKSRPASAQPPRFARPRFYADPDFYLAPFDLFDRVDASIREKLAAWQGRLRTWEKPPRPRRGESRRAPGSNDSSRSGMPASK